MLGSSMGSHKISLALTFEKTFKKVVLDAVGSGRKEERLLAGRIELSASRSATPLHLLPPASSRRPAVCVPPGSAHSIFDLQILQINKKLKIFYFDN